MSYTKQELTTLRTQLAEMIQAVNNVIDEGDARLDPSNQQHERPSDWDYYGGTKATGEMRRRSMDLTRALAKLRRP